RGPLALVDVSVLRDRRGVRRGRGGMARDRSDAADGRRGPDGASRAGHYDGRIGDGRNAATLIRQRVSLRFAATTARSPGSSRNRPYDRRIFTRKPIAVNAFDTSSGS